MINSHTIVDPGVDRSLAANRSTEENFMQNDYFAVISPFETVT